mmetsp:Transcript_23815/g.38788  ORF Transcript_23815/g.38788 Transcript_23815/m.38788 type:complete len:829 (+) Transcript_23815:357-2843(+)
MKLLFSPIICLLASFVSRAGAQSYAERMNLNNSNDKCVSKCMHSKEQNAVVSHVCDQAMNDGFVAYNACSAGRNNAFKQVCEASCDAFNAKTLLRKSHGKACKSVRAKYAWCKRGYIQTWEKLSSFASTIIVEEVSVNVEESVRDLADITQQQQSGNSNVQAIVEEIDQATEKQFESKVGMETLDGDRVSSFQTELVPTQGKNIANEMRHSFESHGIDGSVAIIHFERFTSIEASAGRSHCIDFYTPGWGLQHTSGLSNYDTVPELQTRTGMDGQIVGESSSCSTRICAELADHTPSLHKFFANAGCDGGGGAVAISQATQATDVCQFIDTGPSGPSPLSKSFTREVQWLWVISRHSVEDDLLLLGSSSDVLDHWEHLPADQHHIEEHSKRRVEPKIAFPSHEFISAAEIICSFEPPLDFNLKETTASIMIEVIASRDVLVDTRIDLKLFRNHQCSNDTGSFRSCLLLRSRLTDQHHFARALGREHMKGSQSIGTASELCGTYSSQTLFRYAHVKSQRRVWHFPSTVKSNFNENGACATQVLSTEIPCALEANPVGEQSDHFESYWLDDFVDPLAMEPSSILDQPLLLQLPFSFEVLPHVWPATSRNKPFYSLTSSAPNMTEFSLDLDGGSLERSSFGGFDCIYALYLYSSHEVLRLYLRVSMLLDHVIFNVDSIIPSTIESMYQFGGDGYHLERVVPDIGYPCAVVTLFLLALLYYSCPGVRRIIKSLRAHDAVILETPREVIIKWEFQRQQRVCFAPLVDIKDTNLANASRVTEFKTLHSRAMVESVRLHSDLGPYWNQWGVRGRRHGKRRYLGGRRSRMRRRLGG